MPQNPLDIGIEAVPSKIISFTAFKNVANNNIIMPFPAKLTRNQLRKDQVKHKAKYDSQDSQESLKAEVAALQQELAIVKQQKAELENLLKQQEEARKIQVQEMQIEIDLNKLAHQIAEITQTDYFQQLQIEVESLRHTKIS
jgi:septal ring factor EnvC (AmiA/AmiB activator)